MRINLNDPTQFTLEGVGSLIGSLDDSEHTQLRVSGDGYAYLSRFVVGSEEPKGVLFRFETWVAGNGYVGETAAGDEELWVARIFHALQENWPDPYDDYIEFY